MNFEKLPEPRFEPRPRRRPRWSGAPLLALAVLGAAGAAAWWWHPSGQVPQDKPVPEPAGRREPAAPAVTDAERAAIAALDERAAGHLRRRELYQARKLLGEAWERAEVAARRAPGAHGLDDELRLRLVFLNRRHADLEAVQDFAHGAMRPAPAGGAWLEADRAGELYRRLMGASPDGPAEEFCRRLGWMLGQPVRPEPAHADGRIRARVGAGPGGH